MSSKARHAEPQRGVLARALRPPAARGHRRAPRCCACSRVPPCERYARIRVAPPVREICQDPRRPERVGCGSFPQRAISLIYKDLRQVTPPLRCALAGDRIRAPPPPVSSGQPPNLIITTPARRSDASRAPLNIPAAFWYGGLEGRRPTGDVRSSLRASPRAGARLRSRGGTHHRLHRPVGPRGT